MVTVTVAELQKQFDRYQELALTQPLSIIHHGHESLVVLAADEYQRLKALDTRVAVYAWELPEDLVTALDNVEIPPESKQFNHEMD